MTSTEQDDSLNSAQGTVVSSRCNLSRINDTAGHGLGVGLTFNRDVVSLFLIFARPDYICFPLSAGAPNIHFTGFALKYSHSPVGDIVTDARPIMIFAIILGFGGSKE